MKLQTSRSQALVATATLAGGLLGLRLRSRRAKVSVGEAMTPRPVCLEAHESAQVAARRMAEEGVGALAVCHYGRPVGVLTDRDMVLRVLAQAEDPRCITVGQCLQGDVATVEPGHSLDVAAQRMRAHGVRRLPVLDQGELVGIVTQSDVAEHDPATAGRVERSLGRTGADSRSAAWLFRNSYREARGD
jgi:CBS domain-containing protein